MSHTGTPARLSALRLRFSIGIWVAGVDDADLMIGELCVGAGQIDFGHMASHAVGFGHGADLGVERGGMAGGALGVVGGEVGIHLCMGIVAGGAADAAILRVEAFAVGQPVGLEADIIDAARSVEGDLGPGAVTAAA